MLKRYISFGILIILVFISNSCVLYEMQANSMYNKNIKNQPFDAIIVPGIPFNGKEWDDVMKLRVVWAAYLYEQGITKNIIFSGSAVYTPFVESKIMRQYAIALGVDSNNILVETKAEHSSENIYFSYVKARENALTNVALATDLVQIKMVKKFLSVSDIPVSLLPAKINIIKSIILPENIKIDTMEAYVPNFTSIMQTQKQQYRWRGTQGKNIDFRKYR